MHRLLDRFLFFHHGDQAEVEGGVAGVLTLEGGGGGEVEREHLVAGGEVLPHGGRIDGGRGWSSAALAGGKGIRVTGGSGGNGAGRFLGDEGRADQEDGGEETRGCFHTRPLWQGGGP